MYLLKHSYCEAYKGVVSLWQDDGLLQAAHHYPPQLFQHTLQHCLLTHGSKQRQSDITNKKKIKDREMRN